MQPQFSTLAVVFPLLVGGVGFSHIAEAKRSIRIFPIDTTSQIAANPKMCWAGFNRKIDFVNLSSVAQTVRVKVTGIKVEYVACADTNFASVSSGWTITPGVPNCADAKFDSASNSSLANFEQQVSVPGNGTASMYFNVFCKVHTGEPMICRRDYDGVFSSVPDPSTARVGVSRGEATIELEVNEDRGALLANIVASPAATCANLMDATRFNIPVNGGRPF
jgi:hypothetical protein